MFLGDADRIQSSDDSAHSRNQVLIGSFPSREFECLIITHQFDVSPLQESVSKDWKRSLSIRIGRF